MNINLVKEKTRNEQANSEISVHEINIGENSNVTEEQRFMKMNHLGRSY